MDRIALMAVLTVALCSTSGAMAQHNGPSGQRPPAPATQSQPDSDLVRTLDDRARAFELSNQQQFARAAVALRTVVEATPSDGPATFNLGYALHMSGQIDEALAVHRRAAQFPAFRALAQYNVACALALRGHTDAALDALQLAADAGFDRAGDMAADADLVSLHDNARFATIVDACKVAVAPVRRFDFWVGSWDVDDTAGNTVGTSTIESVEKGNLIIEHWDNRSGGTGTSINFVDPADGNWHQIWVDQSGSVVRSSGAWKDGAIRMAGTSTTRNGATQMTRCAFTPHTDGTVGQLVEQSADGGMTWTTSFDGLYKPKGS